MQSLVQTLRGLGTVRLALIGAAGAGLILFFLFMSSRLSTVDNALLFSNLETSDSSQIVAKLDTLGVPYELKAQGTQIYVPADQALRLRMSLAQDGLPSGGSVGYEIFDQSESFGTTSFVQNVNLLRALEGELARTIRSIGTVKEARVHLVMPKRELFSRREREPSASVFLKVNGNNVLDKSEVLAIQHLVAAAVPGLKPDRISVIDGRGRLLARGARGGDQAQIDASNSDDTRRAYEDRMTREIEELLERSVGVGKVRAQVSAEMNFDRITTSSESYDPEGQVVRSTQTVEESARNADGRGPESVSVQNNLPDANNQNTANGGSSSNSARTEETVNYEISKQVRQHVREIGSVNRLSVAVLIDGTYVKNKDDKRVYKERTADELEKLTKLVKSAVGFDEKRGDKVELINMQFYGGDVEPEQVEPPLFGLTKADYFRIAELVVLAVVGILVILLVVRPLVTRTLDALPTAFAGAGDKNLLSDQSLDSPALSGPEGTGVTGEAVDELINVDQIEGRVRASTINKIGEIVQNHPEETVSIIREWLYQEA